MAVLKFQSCPFCGADPDLLRETEGEETYYICTCADETCEGHNGKVFDDIYAVHAWWNSLEADE